MEGACHAEKVRPRAHLRATGSSRGVEIQYARRGMYVDRVRGRAVFRVLYGGHPGAGRRTNLRRLHADAAARDPLIVLGDGDDQTVETAIALSSATWCSLGMVAPLDYLAATARTPLARVDGVVVVVDPRQPDAARAYLERLAGLLVEMGRDRTALPVVVQRNRRDDAAAPAPDTLDELGWPVID